uniref:Aldo_ket_red domain-containing protein n=1 Tax=Caenorhabditis tropicalis TaxID=1561998 RepID=A0A1I7UTJ7_9PELO
MDFREKFLISFLSKRAKNKLKLTSVPSDIFFDLSDKFSIRLGHYPASHYPKVTAESDHFIGGEVMNLSFHTKGVILEEKSFRKQLLLANHLLDTFRISTISVIMSKPTLSASAWKFMQMVNQRQLSIKSFYYEAGASPEFVGKILDECTEVTDKVGIVAWFPYAYLYTPFRPFKTTNLRINGNFNWSNLESFMNFGYVSIQFWENPTRTAQFYKSFFTKWMDSNARLQRLEFCIEKAEHQLIMNALRKQGIQQNIADEWIRMERKNGIEFFIKSIPYCIIIYTKQAYLDYLKEIEQRALARGLAINLRLDEHPINFVEPMF